jgi:hypothetical protein
MAFFLFASLASAGESVVPQLVRTPVTASPGRTPANQDHWASDATRAVFLFPCVSTHPAAPVPPFGG